MIQTYGECRVAEDVVSALILCWRPIETAPRDCACLIASRCEDSGQRWVAIARWHGNHWCSDDDGMLGGATHWMPLPEPPTETEN